MNQLWLTISDRPAARSIRMLRRTTPFQRHPRRCTLTVDGIREHNVLDHLGFRSVLAPNKSPGEACRHPKGRACGCAVTCGSEGRQIMLADDQLSAMVKHPQLGGGTDPFFPRLNKWSCGMKCARCLCSAFDLARGARTL